MSIYRSLYLWFEGTDDGNFIERIVIPKFGALYDDIRPIPYAERSNQYVNNLIKNLPAMAIDYLFFADLDDEPCVTQKKALLQRHYSSLDLSRVIVVKKEIESWYLAGLDGDACAALNIRPEPNTETIDKERFNQMLPKTALSRVNTMIEMLNHYDIATAKQKNGSFAYFADKYGL